jgi:hypothetical protein
VKLARRAGLAALLALAPALGAYAQAAQPTTARSEQPPDVPAGDARIVGRVLQGAENTPVPDVEVILYSLAPDGMPGLRRTRSGADGAFAFEGVSSTANVAYLVGARHRDIPVPGGRIELAPGQRVASADIHVAELTSDMSSVHVRSQTLRLLREAAGLRIEETFEIEVSGDEIAFVPARERRRKPPGLLATLPAGASDFQMPLGVIPDGLERRGAAHRYFGPFYPGKQDLSWSYRLARGEPLPEGTRFRFEFTPADGVESFHVLVPAGTGAFDAPGLANVGAADRGGRAATRFSVAHPAGALTMTLDVPAAHVDPNAISVHEVQIVLHADDAAISVQETHAVSASGNALLVGTPETPLLRVPLPPDASDVRFGSEAAGLAFAPHPDGGVAVLGSHAPGDATVQIAYRVPVGAGGARLARDFALRVPLLRMFVADTGRSVPSSERLHRARPVRTEDLNYLALEAFDVAAGEEVVLALDPLPPRGAGSPLAARALAVGVGLGLLAWVAWPIIRRLWTSESVEASDAVAPIERAASPEREAIYDAIRDLDHDFETAKVSAEDHARLREELRVRAAELIRAEESAPAVAAAAASAAGGASRPTPDAQRACARCGAEAATAHRFCASCGAPLEAPAA